MKLVKDINDKGDLVLYMHGKFDSVAVKNHQKLLEAIVVTGETKVILDLTQVDFIDSSGIGVIVFLFKRLKIRGSKFQLIGVHGQAQAMLRLLRIDRIIDINWLDSPIELVQKNIIRHA